VALRPDSGKCVALLQRLQRIHEQTEAATAAFDDGRWHAAMEQYSLALAWDVSGATAFTAHTLTRRAAAAAECSRVEDALRDLDRSALPTQANAILALPSPGSHYTFVGRTLLFVDALFVRPPWVLAVWYLRPVEFCVERPRWLVRLSPCSASLAVFTTDTEPRATVWKITGRCC